VRKKAQDRKFDGEFILPGHALVCSSANGRSLSHERRHRRATRVTSNSDLTAASTDGVPTSLAGAPSATRASVVVGRLHPTPRSPVHASSRLGRGSVASTLLERPERFRMAVVGLFSRATATASSRSSTSHRASTARSVDGRSMEANVKLARSSTSCTSTPPTYRHPRTSIASASGEVERDLHRQPGREPLAALSKLSRGDAVLEGPFRRHRHSEFAPIRGQRVDVGRGSTTCTAPPPK